MLETALAHARSQQDAYLQQFMDLLRIPSVSTLPEHAPDIERVAQWLADHLSGLGLENVQILRTPGNPVVYGDWLGAGPAAPTLVIYGHYDVQPADPLDEWATGPFTPTIRDGAVFARGASDNKGQFFAHLKAVDTILAATGRLPINIKFVLDGEEEVGSPNIAWLVQEYGHLFAADAGLISDGAMLAHRRPSLDYGVRGLTAMEIHVRGPRRDLHSGSFGGTVLNPVQALAEMIAQLHDANGTVTIPGFYDRVRPVDTAERARLAAVPYTETQWQAETGAPQPWGEAEYSLMERIGARPTCEVNGIWGGFQGAGSKTIIPAEAGAKITLRLVPDQDPDEVARLFSDYITQITPPQVQVEVTGSAHCWPALMPVDSAEVQAAIRANEAVWGVRPVLSRGGGSLPVIAVFQQQLGIPFLLMPFGLDDNRHGPNEHLLLENFHNSIHTAIHFYYNLGR
jgi:acetylornithine deacetylase/succinyl-diaminopimelate desuccinylase-like protein